MENVPTQTKKQSMLSFLKPNQRVALALTNKKQSEWIRPILEFMRKPFSQKVIYIKTTGGVRIPDDIVMEALVEYHDPIDMIAIHSGLPNGSLKDKVRKLMEDRIKNRDYRKLIKKTIIQLYFQYLVQIGKTKTIPRFIHTIKSPQVKSTAIVEYINLTKNELSPSTLRKWVDEIPDEHTRRRMSNIV